MTQIQLNKNLFCPVYIPHLFNYDTRTEVYYGGAGSGKSVFVAQKLLVKALNDKRIILVVRKTLTSQYRSCWKLLTDTLSQWKILDRCNVNVSHYQIELPNKSIIYVAGIDDPERIKSIVGITDIWLEEATECTVDDYSQLQLRCRSNAKNSQIICSFNPISKTNWVYSRWFGESPSETDVKIIKTTYKDNPFLPKEYVQHLEEMINTNPTYYKIYALGEFCTLDKLVYNNWQVSEFDKNALQGDLMCGLDFGYTNDPTAFTASIIDDESKTIHVIKEWVDKGKTNDEIAKAITALGFSKSTIIADSAEQKSIEELRRNGLYRIKESVKGKDSIIHGIQLLQQYKIIVHPSCTNTITEFENYSWEKEKGTNEYKNVPIDAFNHCLDSLRYSLQCSGKGKLKTFDKGVLGL